MEKNKYNQIFADLGIDIEPLTFNYNPDAYGHHLIENINHRTGVSYDASTDYKIPQNNPEKIK